MGFFDDFLKTTPAEDQAILAKYPQLRDSIAKIETDRDNAVKYATGWLDWQNREWDNEAGMPKAEKQLRAELATANARLTAAEGGGADAAEVAKLRQDMEAKADAVKKESLNAIEGMNFFYQATGKRLLPHYREFNEDLDPQALMQYMQQNKINDPDIAYDRMVAPRRAELATQRQKDLEEKHTKDIQDAELRGREKAAQELAMGPAGMMPTDGSGGIAGVTAQIGQPAKISDEAKARFQDGKLGDGSLATLGYEMFRRGELQPQQ